MADEWSKRARGRPAQPVRWGGQDYPSKVEAIRRHYGVNHAGTYYQEMLEEAIRRGEAVLLPPARPIDQPGAAGAARRLLRAAEEIAAVSSSSQEEDGDGWTRAELRKRRKGLVKALHLYRQRHGCGVIDTLEGEA
jgi:hypothetical protein